jgi:hypothetical protein
MKKYTPIISSLLFGIGSATAAQGAVHCLGQKSEMTVVQTQIELPQNTRTKIFDLDESPVYLTQKKEFYSLEMFIPGLEQRIYAEGTMSEKQPLSLSLWTRDQLLEVRCQQVAGDSNER